jgi:hypothetical protein
MKGNGEMMISKEKSRRNSSTTNLARIHPGTELKALR